MNVKKIEGRKVATYSVEDSSVDELPDFLRDGIAEDRADVVFAGGGILRFETARERGHFAAGFEEGVRRMGDGVVVMNWLAAKVAAKRLGPGDEAEAEDLQARTEALLLKLPAETQQRLKTLGSQL